MASFVRPIAAFLTSILDPNAYITGSDTSSDTTSSEQEESPIDNAKEAVNHSPIAVHEPSISSSARELREPEKFVAALQRAAELWSVFCAVKSEVEDLHQQTRQLYSDLDLQNLEFARLSAISMKDNAWLEFKLRGLEHGIRLKKESLEGGESRPESLNRARLKMTQTAAELDTIISRILRSSQRHIDASCSTGYIGNLKVDLAFCQGLTKTRECALQLAEVKKQHDSALNHYANLVVHRVDAVKAASSTETRPQPPGQGHEQRSKATEVLRVEAKAEYDKCKQLLEVRTANQLHRRGAWLRNTVIPALQKSRLLNQTYMVPGLLVPSPISSTAGLSPLRENCEPAGTRTPDYHPLQQTRVMWRKDMQRHINQLERFKMQYQSEYTMWLYTYGGSNEEAWQAEALRKYGKSYDALCVDGQWYIDAARQELDKATDRLIEAGLEIPPSPTFGEEYPPPNKYLRRRIRKHQRGVARGDLGPLPATPPPIPTGSSVRDLQSNDSHGFPFKDVIEEMKKKWHPQQQDLRLQTMKERRRKGREVWVGRMKYSKRGWNLKSPTADRNKAASKPHPHE